MEKQAKLDRISNLPWNVLDNILVNLPLRDAARTSILSSKWRYKWTGLSQFVFDDKCFSRCLSEKARWVEIMKIVQMVRTYHRGPIEKFKLSTYCSPNFCDLDLWIQFLMEKGIKELILQDFLFMKRFKLPCVFSCPQLSCLELYGCVFKLPSTFKGFHCLKSLQLTQVSILSDTLESLIPNCPILERLTLLNIDHLATVRIHNPNLKYLKIDSEFEDINLEHSVQLASVDIRMIPMYGRDTYRDFEQYDSSRLVQVFGALYDVERLTLSSHFLEWLASDKVPPERLPIRLNHLIFLDLKDVKLSNLKELMASLSIFRSCPNLEELSITVIESNSTRPTTDFLKAMCLCGFLFHKLKVVRMRGVIGTSAEWEFIKFVLTCSPQLEIMIIVNYLNDRIPESMLLQVDRASEHAKIISLTL